MHKTELSDNWGCFSEENDKYIATEMENLEKNSLSSLIHWADVNIKDK